MFSSELEQQSIIHSTTTVLPLARQHCSNKNKYLELILLIKRNGITDKYYDLIGDFIYVESRNLDLITDHRIRHAKYFAWRVFMLR